MDRVTVQQTTALASREDSIFLQQNLTHTHSAAASRDSAARTNALTNEAQSAVPDSPHGQHHTENCNEEQGEFLRCRQPKVPAYRRFKDATYLGDKVVGAVPLIDDRDLLKLHQAVDFQPTAARITPACCWR